MSGARIALVGVAALGAALVAAPDARADTVARITFRELRVDADTGRQRGPQREITVTLKGGAQIQDRDQRVGVGRRAGPPRIAVNESALGDDFRREQGRGAIGRWRVGPNNTLIRGATYQTYTETITLSLVGRSACQVSIYYARSPGAALFINRGGRFASIQAVEPRCEIGDR